mmetsp:Transcript_33890/g.59074  ORF Transcript_33890/g.59074 Transcript_33890/m.59074 type:complete len:108 (-) Transcript_33890:480-803(-)
MLARRLLRLISSTGVPTLPKDVYGVQVDVSKPHQASKLTHQSNAEELVHRVAPIVVDDDVVRCFGTSAVGIGHPVEYIQLNTTEPHKPAVCKWCSLRFIRNPALGHH